MTGLSPQGSGGEREPLFPLPGLADGLLAEGNSLWQGLGVLCSPTPELMPMTPVLLQYPPPLIPPRGEVNAADAFDIGSFDEEDTKGIKVLGLAWPLVPGL